jgi:hypothetical protein
LILLKRRFKSISSALFRKRRLGRRSAHTRPSQGT